MISISECIEETVCEDRTSCSNKLDISEIPAIVFTNRTSFVGVNAFVRPVCECRPFDTYEICLNGGTYDEENKKCICPPEYDGPNCEALAIGFRGNGWAMYPSFEACNNTRITLEVTADEEEGLIFYVGPMSTNPKPLVEGKLNFTFLFAITFLFSIHNIFICEKKMIFEQNIIYNLTLQILCRWNYVMVFHCCT